MYHATSPENAESILAEGRFRPSLGGMLGAGVYASHSFEKAWWHGQRNVDAGGRFVVFKLLVYVGRVKA